MAVFDKASLVMIPSQYKEGKIYNIKPEDQSSSFEFERGSAATRVNSDGLIEQTGVSSTQLWNDDSIYLNGTASYNNGIVTFTASVNNDYILFQNLEGVEQSNYYEISFDTVVNSGSFSLLQGTGSSFVPNYLFNETGSYKRIVQYTHATPYQILFWSSNSSSLGAQFDGTISNISIKKVNIDTPRLDYSGTEPSLLLEPQRTNIVEDSWDTNTWTWGKDANPNNTTRSFGYSAPDGSNNATLFTRNAGTTGWFSWGNITTNVSADFTYSIFVKKGTSNTIELKNVSTSPQSRVVYDFDTDSFTTESNATGKSVAYGNGWYRISMTYANGTAASSQIRHTLEDGESAYVFGSQAEQGSYATSYIPTNGQTETRLADICQGGGDESTFNDSEGVLYAEIEYFKDTQIISISDGGNNEQIWIYLTGSNLRFYVFRGGVSQANITGTYNVGNDGFVKVAGKYKQNDFALWINGVEVDTHNSGNTPIGLNTMRFSRGDGNSTFFPQCNVRALHYFPEALTDTELQQLTTI